MASIRLVNSAQRLLQAWEVHYGADFRWQHWTPVPVAPLPREPDASKWSFKIPLNPLFGMEPHLAARFITQFVQYHTEVHGFHQVILLEHGPYLAELLKDQHTSLLVQSGLLEIIEYNQIMMHSPGRPFMDKGIMYPFILLSFIEDPNVRILFTDYDEFISTLHGKRFVDLFRGGECLQDAGIVHLAKPALYCKNCSGDSELEAWAGYDYQETLPRYTISPSEHFWDAATGNLSADKLKAVNAAVNAYRDVVDPTDVPLTYFSGSNEPRMRGVYTGDINCTSVRHLEHRLGQSIAQNRAEELNLVFSEGHGDDWAGPDGLGSQPHDEAWLWWQKAK